MGRDHLDDLLQKGVDRVLKGEVWVERQLVTSLLHILRKKNVERDDISIPENLRNLTPREMEIAMRLWIDAALSMGRVLPAPTRKAA